MKTAWISFTVLILLAALTLFFLFGHGEKQVASHEGDTAPAGAEWRLRLGHNSKTDSALHWAAQKFADRIKTRSDGRIAVSIHPAQELGNDHQMVEMARAGNLDFLLTPTAKFSAAIPSMQYADLPFYFPSREALYAMLDGEPGRMLLTKLESIGLVGVAFWENGFKHFTANHPLITPEDFKGLKFRVMKSRLIIDQFKELGAHAIPIDFHATRQALKAGVVDGQENPLVAIHNMGFHEVQSDLTLSGHAFLGYVFSISAQTFDHFPVDLQTLILETIRELTPLEREETRRREEGFIDQIKAAGVRIHRLTPQARKAFMKVLAHIPSQFEEQLGPDLISKTEELLAELAPEDERGNSLLIGLDADLSSDAAPAGLAIKRGMMLAAREINAAGGVLGRPLKILARDHRAMPSRGVANINHFAQKENLIAMMGGLHSWVALAEAPEAHRLKLPFLIPWAAANGIVDNGQSPNWVFRASVNDKFVGPFLVKGARDRGYDRVALLLENSVWGRSNHVSITERLDQLGLKPVLVKWFDRSEGEVAPTLTAIEKSGAEVILLVANPWDGVKIIDALAERPDPLPVISHWGITGGAFWKQARKALKRVDLTFLQTFSFLAHANQPKVARIIKAYGQAFDVQGPEAIFSPVGTAQAYDLVHMLAAAVEKAGSADRAAIRKALEELGTMEGLIRDYDPPFTPERHEALEVADYHLARFDEAGRIVIFK